MIPTLQLGQFGRDGSAFVGPLNAYTTNLWSALSVSRLLSSWRGASMTVRESGGNTLASIGFKANGSFDTVALSAHLASNDGFMNAFINQAGISGQGFNQSTNSKQPKVGTAGVFYGAAYFDGTDDSMASGSATNTFPAMTVFLRGTLRSTATAQILVEHSVNYNSNNSCIAYYDSAAPGFLSIGMRRTSPAGYALSHFNSDAPNSNVQAYRFDRGAGTAAAMTELWINGSKETRDGNADSGTLPAGNFTAANWFLAARNNASTFAALDLHTLLIYQDLLTDADMTAVSNIVAALP